MTYQGPRSCAFRGDWLEPAAGLAGRALLAILLAGTAVGEGGTAEFKRDFRGLETGMTVAEAKTAAAKNGMTCETGFTDLTTCRGGDASVVLTTTGRPANRIWELQVTLAGHYGAAAMRQRLDGFYGLKPTATPSLFDTASGQELMLLEIGETSTIFYLRDPRVLYADPRALPPPKL